MYLTSKIFLVNRGEGLCIRVDGPSFEHVVKTCCEDYILLVELCELQCSYLCVMSVGQIYLKALCHELETEALI